MCNIKHICIVFFVTISTVAQSKFESFLTPSDTLNLPRRNAVIISESSTMGLSIRIKPVVVCRLSSF